MTVPPSVPPTDPAGIRHGRMLAHRTTTSFDFFLLCVIAGAVLGLGYLLDSQAVLLFAALLVPLMAPWVGLGLATVTGSARGLLRSALSLALAGGLIFLAALLSGVAARIWAPLPLTNLAVHSRLWWPDLIVLALGAILLSHAFARVGGRPVLPGVALAYELFLPLGAAGFALGHGLPDVFRDGLVVFCIHLIWATVFGVATLAALGFRPSGFAGYVFGTALVLAALVGLAALTGLGTALDELGLRPAPLPSPTVAPPPTLAPPPSPTLAPSPTATHTPAPSATPTFRFPPTETPTPTLTPKPTPVYALIQAPVQYGGAVVRSAPDGQVITTVDNGEMVQVLPEIREYRDANWVRVIVTRNGRTLEGWILQSVLVTATPAPGW